MRDRNSSPSPSRSRTIPSWTISIVPVRTTRRCGTGSAPWLMIVAPAGCSSISTASATPRTLSAPSASNGRWSSRKPDYVGGAARVALKPPPAGRRPALPAERLLSRSCALPPTIIVVMHGLIAGRNGRMDPSAMRSERTPRTRRRGSTTAVGSSPVPCGRCTPGGRRCCVSCACSRSARRRSERRARERAPLRPTRPSATGRRSCARAACRMPSRVRRARRDR